MSQQIDIADILGSVASATPHLGTHQARLEAIMRHFCGAGLTLAVSGDVRHLNRATSTMKAYARRFGLAFPDYIPTALRPKKVSAK